MVVDLIDKPSNIVAQITFSLKVEEEMRAKGWLQEADFTKTFRECYEAEDAAGLPAVERQERRMAMREMLLDNFNFNVFPPPGSHIRGIPMVMFEGILTNIDHRIQLYEIATQKTFNVRSIRILDSENFFGEFIRIDPKGTGVLMPVDIPHALQTASYILNARMDVSRYVMSQLQFKYSKLNYNQMDF